MLTEALLERELAALGSFPRHEAKAEILCVRPGPDLRELRTRIDLDPTLGAIGDRWIRKTWVYLPDGRPDPRVQVAIGNVRLITLIQGLTGVPHHPGDTLLTALDLSEDNLPAGTLLRIGTAVLRISDIENDACAKFAARHGAVVFNWIRRPENRARRLRGLFASVVQAGYVCADDPVIPLRES